MKKEIFGGPRRTDAKATCAGRAGKRRTDPISTRRFFAKRSAEGSDGAKKKDREIDVGRLVSRDPQGRPNLERRVRPPRSVCPQHVGESAIFQRFKIAPVSLGCGCGMLNVHPSAPGVELGPGTARPPEVVALREIDD